MGIDIRDIAEASGKAADKRPAPTVWYVHESYSLESVEDEEGLAVVRRREDGKEETVQGLTGVRVYEDGRVEYVKGKELIHYVTAVPLGPDIDSRSLPMTVGGSAGSPEEFGGDGGYGHVYAPLKYHDIFLEFAALAEEPITPEVVKGWCDTYGTLGAPLLRECPVRGGFIQGRTDWHQDVAEFARHARIANQVLRLFEAYSDPEGLDVETMRRHGARGDTPEQLKANAESIVLDTLNQILASEIYPVRYPRRGGGGYIRGDAFRSLLGALYVQFDRLLDTPEDERTRCRWWKCNRVIDFETPDDLPDQGRIKNDRRKGYTTREDKEFCSKSHANSHYYWTVTKPKREAERRGKNKG